MPRLGRIATRTGLAIAVLIGVVALLLALPVPVWRTGRLPEPPLPVIESGPQIELSHRVWIDTDAACGLSRRSDPDDCLTLMLLARAPNIEIAGVSSVFGNAALKDTDRTVRTLADKLRAEGAKVPQIMRGAAAPGTPSTPAEAALQQALAQGPLTILALGPLTNIAAALQGRAALQTNVVRIVAVMGRRPGHIFHPSEGVGHGMLFGHGPVFRDLNFDLDRDAAVKIVAMGLPLSLIPYDVARGVSLTSANLDTISHAGPVGDWVASGARGWLDFWQTDIGLPGFHPYDLLAGAYLLDPAFFDCAMVNAWVGHDDQLHNLWFSDPVALQVAVRANAPGAPLAESSAVYCVTTDAALEPWLMKRLAGGTTQAHL
ncbi:nucleoside hydrolase [Devosia algicola]|uniref:Nucleoside hydrolase n=1 Tax=Devosia algicola TaxID=3026418 RepID=A0ABY7YL53_9HYPH|nr:nucleoside hydrolase [Devosia algicola]WDR01924.1 nucleoside hydrolase [Devosia algicola]